MKVQGEANCRPAWATETDNRMKRAGKMSSRVSVAYAQEAEFGSPALTNTNHEHGPGEAGMSYVGLGGRSVLLSE